MAAIVTALRSMPVVRSIDGRLPLRWWMSVPVTTAWMKTRHAGSVKGCAGQGMNITPACARPIMGSPAAGTCRPKAFHAVMPAAASSATFSESSPNDADAASAVTSEPNVTSAAWCVRMRPAGNGRPGLRA